MKKMMISLIIITMCLAIFPACASIQVMQFDNSLVLPQDQLGIAINNNAVGTYTVANYQNTLFIDSTFFKYYFGVTEDQIKENVS